MHRSFFFFTFSINVHKKKKTAFINNNNIFHNFHNKWEYEQNTSELVKNINFPHVFIEKKWNVKTGSVWTPELVTDYMSSGLSIRFKNEVGLLVIRLHFIFKSDYSCFLWITWLHFIYTKMYS